MELAVYIQKHSDRVVSQLLGVPERTVASWRRLERAPKTLQAQEIIDRSGGVVTWQGIYQPYARYRRRQLARAAGPASATAATALHPSPAFSSAADIRPAPAR